MAFSLVNTVQVGTDPVTGTITLALGTLSAGNGVIVGVSMLDSTTVTVSGVTCGGEALTSTAAITRITTGSGCAGSVQFWYLSGVTTGGSKSVVVTLSTATSTTEAFAFAVDGSIAFDTGTDQVATGSSTSQSVSLTTSAANAIIVAVGLSGYANGDLTAGGAYTAIALTNWDGNFHGEYDLDAGAAGSKTADMSTAGSGPWAIKAAAFKSAGPAAYSMPAAQGSYALTGQDVQFSENLGGRDTSGLVVGSSASWIGASYVGAKDASPGGGGSPYSMPAAQGSYSLSGQAAALRVARRLTAAQGSYTLNGQAVALRLGKNMAAAQGSYALTGQATAFARGRRLVAAQGSYAITGQDGLVDIVMAAAAGSYALNGQDVGLTYSGAGARTMPAAQGSYTLTGQAAALRVARRLVADAGAYALTGVAAGLKAGRSLAAAFGSYTLAGQDVTLTYSGVGPKVLTAAAGVYALTGRDVTLTYSGAPAVLSGGETMIRWRRRAAR